MTARISRISKSHVLGASAALLAVVALGALAVLSSSGAAVRHAADAAAEKAAAALVDDVAPLHAALTPARTARAGIEKGDETECVPLDDDEYNLPGPPHYEVDSNDDGSVTMDELSYHVGYEQYGMPQPLFDSYAGEDGVLSSEELHGMPTYQAYDFADVDLDGDGGVTMQELHIHQGRVHGPSQDLFERCAGTDGVLSPGELAALYDMHAYDDGDDPGDDEYDEYDEYDNEGDDDRCAHPYADEYEHLPGPAHAELDRDADGGVSMDEFSYHLGHLYYGVPSRPVFDGYAGEDGVLNSDELRQMPTLYRGEDAVEFAALDLDSDGALTLDELFIYNGRANGPPQELFDRCAGADGALSPGELASLYVSY